MVMAQSPNSEGNTKVVTMLLHVYNHELKKLIYLTSDIFYLNTVLNLPSLKLLSGDLQ